MRAHRPSSASGRARGVLAGALVLAAACSSSGAGGGGPGGDTGGNCAPGVTTCLAFESDFADYRLWQSFDIPNGPPEGTVHVAGPRTVYINRAPPHGSTEFPVGTIIVKDLNQASVLPQTFALVKRGGDYNRAGAKNWEWFELIPQPDGTVTIGWRGTGPTSGDPYGTTLAGIEVCNDCHEAAATNDFVQTPALKLANF